jgi:hypothetical protein
VLGWLADLFRLAWGLLYWNSRKAWFQRNRDRARCPCQNPSDSGRALETGCEACTAWSKPARFRRVCPLLVETPKGLRCAANTADVRPFWGRAAAAYGGGLLAIYLAGAITVFAFLRTIGYPISIVHVTWPGLWYRVPQARGWFFAQKAQRALDAGRTAEGLLYLANAYQFDPSNYSLALSLAKSFQAGRPRESDTLFLRLLREHPDQRDATAQEWFRALLARGDFPKIAGLAANETLVDPADAHVWIRALLFATRQLGDDAPLRTLLENQSPAARAWHHVVEVELLMRARRFTEARAALDRPWLVGDSPFTIYYRVSTLTKLGDTFAALDTLETFRTRLGDDEAYAALKLDALADANAPRTLRAKVDELLAPRLTLPRVMTLCAYLIRHPDTATFARLYDKVQREQLPLDTSSAGVWFTLLCTAGAVGDLPRLHALVVTLKLAANSPFIAVSAIEAFFRGQTGAEKITSFLPVIPVPIEINYALIDRYAAPPALSAAARPKSS